MEFNKETKVPRDEFIVSRTDLEGNITFANETFLKISGYSMKELIGKPHSILRHPDMPNEVFKNLWETISKGRKWEGIIKNLRKDKGFYWVYATISSFYEGDKLVGYKSIRAPISKIRKQNAQKEYDKLKQQEK